MSENVIGDTPKKNHFVVSVLFAVIIGAAAFLVPAYFKQVPQLASWGAALILAAICCPWIRKNAGNLGMPIAGLALLYFGLSNAEFPSISLPSSEEIKSYVPEISWNKDEKPSTESQAETAQQTQQSTAQNEASNPSQNDSAQSTQSTQQVSSVAQGTITPSRQSVSIRQEVRTAIDSDSSLLAVFQKTDQWSSWLSYSIWVKKKYNLDASESEWRGMRKGLSSVQLDAARIDARRDELLALGNVEVNAQGYAQGKDNEAVLLVNSIYAQYKAEVDK